MKRKQTSAEQMRAWLAFCRLTPAQVAGYTSIPESTILAIEAGRLNPDPVIMNKLNRFFSQYQLQYTQNMQAQHTQLMQSHSEGRTAGYSPEPPFSPKSYPGGSGQTHFYSVEPPSTTKSYPGRQPVRSHPGRQQIITQAYPEQRQMSSYDIGGVQTQQGFIAPVTMQQSQYYAQNPNQSQSRARSKAVSHSGLSVFGAVLQILFFCLPIVFIFFPFLTMITSAADGVLRWENMSGTALFIFSYAGAFPFAAFGAQVSLWLTLIAGVLMVVFTLISLAGVDLRAVRTVLFYCYAVGVIFAVIGLVAATIDDVVYWAFGVFTLTVIIAMVIRVAVDGGMQSFTVRK